MSQPFGQCPNCAAPITFQWQSAVQTVCTHCRSVVVRHDVDLKAIGEISDLPDDASPIQLGTEGRFDNHSFRVVGRIVYEYENGGWNEWHLVFSDGTSGWLSDAQAEYAVSRLVTPPRPLPDANKVRVGTPYEIGGQYLSVATRTEARYKGVDGELPFEYWGKEDILFADLRSPDTTFATIDYSETPALLFVGRFVEYDELALHNVRTFDGSASELNRSTRGFNCKNCGAPVPLRALQHTLAVACASCGAILDPHDANLVVLQEHAKRARIDPLIPLGTRGTIEGHQFEVIGFQRRSITVEGIDYFWQEYVVFNPYYGFRYLSEYEGHWNVIRPLRAMPSMLEGDDSAAGTFDGVTYRHFQSAEATTVYVLGEFPWRVRAGDVVRVADYMSPPWLLSSESTGDETTWSLGQYTSGERIRDMFGLPDALPPASGLFANQPSPYAGQPRRFWVACAALVLALAALLLGRELLAAREPIFAQRYTFDPLSVTEPAFTTGTFNVKSPGTLDVDLAAGVTNAWLGLDLALIDVGTGTAFDFGDSVSYYYGRDEDGGWSEGSTKRSLRLPVVPAGEYYLRVQPEAERQGPPISYSITIRRDVPSLIPYALALLLLLVPPALVQWRGWWFERRRWAESDHAPVSVSVDDDDDHDRSDDDD